MKVKVMCRKFQCRQDIHLRPKPDIYIYIYIYIYMRDQDYT